MRDSQITKIIRIKAYSVLYLRSSEKEGENMERSQERYI